MGGLVLTTLIMSFGFHYYETTNQSLTLQYFDQAAAPVVFGRQRSCAAATNIAVGLAIYAMAFFLPYMAMYLIMGLVLCVLGVWGFRQNPVRENLPLQRRRMVFRRRYVLFYLLTFLAGARRQVFVAFAVFLMVKRFDFTVQEITLLFIANNAVNYYLSPLIGRAILRYGERRVLSLEYSAMVLIFLAYTWVETKWVVAVLYILDHIFFNFAIAVRTYFQKVSDPRDIAPSMAVGFTINHIAAVALPALGGFLWMVDYRIPFIAGAFLALLSLLAVQFIATPTGS
jgi:predicted MFS family arabinose efflux permease